MQNNDFRSATNLRSLGRLRSNNTFATATNLGNVSPNATSVSFRASGTVGRADNVDFYKFTVSPGVNLPSGRNSYRLRGGSAILSVYAEIQGRRFFGGKSKLQQGSTSVADFLNNPSQSSGTVYFKLERRTGETRYNFKLDFFR